MPKEATGELRTLADGFAARITIHGRKRRDFMLTTCTSDVEAAERCKALASMASRLRRAGKVREIEPLLEMGAKARVGRPWDFVVAAVDAECAGQTREKGSAEIPTFKKWAEEWTSGDLTKKYPDHVREKRSADHDAQLLRVHVLPHVEGVRVHEFTLDDAERVMANIPPDRAAGTRRLIAHVMSRVMKLAVYPGKWRKDNPIPAGWLPKEGAAKAKECLYPDEDALLMRGVSVEQGKPDVPVVRRLAYGFLAREGMRTDEMAGLRWRAVDLERGRVVLDLNKTDDPRDWDLRPDVVEALSRWKKRQPCTEPTDHVFADNGVPINVQHLAAHLRTDLRRVGVTREQLFERSKVRQPIRAHDLRATFVTISLSLDKSETWISDRTGHQSHKMINAYRRKARTWNQGDLGPLSDLIPELRQAPAEPPPRAVIAPRLPHASTIQPNSQTLNLKCMTSPSRTTYSLPSIPSLPESRALASPPNLIKSSHQMTSALMKPFSKSVWMAAAACGALVPRLMVQARTSTLPAVKYVMRPRSSNPVRTTA
jgi:integrase